MAWLEGQLKRFIESIPAGTCEVAAIVQSKGYIPEAQALIHYGKAGVEAFIPKIRETFENTTKADVKISAAWAIATMTGEQSAVAYLIEAARLAVDGKSVGVISRDVIRDLGSIQSPEVKPILEVALMSSDPQTVEAAIVNLIYNQGESEKALQVIANQLNDSVHAKLPWDFCFAIAAQNINNPLIEAAARNFAKTDAIGDWERYVVERKDWSPSGWIYSYVVKLNRPLSK